MNLKRWGALSVLRWCLLGRTTHGSHSFLGSPFRFDLGTVGNGSAVAVVNRTLAEGPNSLFVRATDQAGNAQATPTEFQWSIDTTVPLAQLLFTPDNTSNVTVPTNRSWPSRVGSADAEFRFDAAGEGLGAPGSPGPQRFQGHLVTSRFQITLDGVVRSGFYCGPGAFLCGATCRVLPVCDRDPTDGVALDPLNASCFAALVGCDGGGRTSPLRLANLAVTSHTLAVVAVDTIGNVGPPAQYSWIVDSTSPTVAIGDVTAPIVNGTAEFRFGFRAVAAPGRRECIRRFECGVAPRISSEPTVTGWAECGATLGVLLCNSSVDHTVRLAGVSTLPTTTQSAGIVQAIARALPSGVHSVGLRAVAQTSQYPFDVVYRGGTVVAPGRRFAWEHLATAETGAHIVLNLTRTTREQCLAACSGDLSCAAVTYVGAASRCVGLAGAVTAWVVDTAQATSYRRDPNATAVPAIDLGYRVVVSQPAYGHDTLREVTSAMDAPAYTAALSAALAGHPATATLFPNVTVFATLVCVGFQSNGPRVGELAGAWTEYLAATRPGVPLAVTTTGAAAVGHALHVAVAVTTAQAGASAIAGQIATGVSSGAYFQQFLARNQSLFDHFGANATLTVSAGTSLAWLTVDVARSLVVTALHQFNGGSTVAHPSETVSSTDVVGVVVAPFTHPSFPTTSFATLSFTVGGTERRINQTAAASIATAINTLRFRALLRANTSAHRAQFNQFTAPTVGRVINVEALVGPVLTMPPTLVQAVKPSVEMITQSHQTMCVGPLRSHSRSFACCPLCGVLGARRTCFLTLGGAWSSGTRRMRAFVVGTPPPPAALLTETIHSWCGPRTRLAIWATRRPTAFVSIPPRL